MNDKNETKKYFEQLGGIKLSESSRARIAKELDSYANFHTATTDERILRSDRSREYAGQASVWQSVLLKLNRKTMHAFVVVTLMIIGGGTSLAAENSIPGDFLYPVKTQVNENVRGALAFSADSKARLEADLLEERVAEAEALEAEGRLSGTLATRVESNIATQYEKARTANAAADGETKTSVDGNLRLALSRFTELSTNGNLAVDTRAKSSTDTYAITESDERASANSMASADADVAMSTSLGLEPISVDQIYTQTQARIKSLRELLERYEEEIQADVYAELNATLDEAASAQTRVLAQANTDLALEVAYEASDLVGKIEAALTTMGEATIDTDTGAILDIDFNNPPPTEPVYEVDPTPLPLPMPPETLETDINTEASLERSTGISL